LNALAVYKNLRNLKSNSEKDYLKAHKMLLKDLIEEAGTYRKKAVGIVKGSKVEHLAPPHENVPFLMNDLFLYLKDKSEISLIKSCVFHYEMEFIHPLMDGNGKMGRLWQTLIFMEDYPIFEFLPFETLIAKNQAAYYNSLSSSDKEGKSTKFIEYMLCIIDESLNELRENRTKKLSDEERIKVFVIDFIQEFTRKDYLNYYKDLSAATASRDLKKALEMGIILKNGDKNSTAYRKN
jgi:Fic family protein